MGALSRVFKMFETEVTGQKSSERIEAVEQRLVAELMSRLVAIEFRWIDKASGYDVSRRYELSSEVPEAADPSKSSFARLKFLSELQVAKDELAGRAIIQAHDNGSGNEVGFAGDDGVAMSAIAASGFGPDCDRGCVGVIVAGAGQASGVKHLEGAASQGRRSSALRGLAIKATIDRQGVRASRNSQNGQQGKAFHKKSLGCGVAQNFAALVEAVKIAIRNTAGCGVPSVVDADRGQARLQVAPFPPCQLGHAVASALYARLFLGG
jgi:hypothetical protein